MDQRRDVPGVDRVLGHLEGLPRELLTDCARSAVDAARSRSLAGESVELDDVISDARRRVDSVRDRMLRPVVNATGVILHTNLGRAPIGEGALEHAREIGAGYSNLEYRLGSGSRGSRHEHAGALLARACGAEAGLVVNNNAAAVLLSLGALARGRDVVVSRGELVEIGGGFRVPEIMEESGCRLVEVGTTNRTRRTDYSGALTDATALLLKVHASNYRMVGFTETTPIEELARLGPDVMVDAGSGLLDETTPWLPHRPRWLRDEPGVRQVIAAGAAIVTFSGDKLLGGPQAGVIVGRAEPLARIARHPLARAVRADKLTLAALQDVAMTYLSGDATSIPLWRMATRSVDSLRARSESIARTVPGAKVVETDAVAGGGSLPGLTIPSVGVAIETHAVEAALARLRREGIVARVSDGAVVCDLRTVEPHDDEQVAARAQVMRTLATAGHVDHGKSSLVLALTGTDPDRFPEEKARGLTIDLGFAFTTLPSGEEIGFVDVPGHVRFIKNMLAGVGAIDLALFVVAANEGWMPQSEEHLRILELVGVRRGVVALAKADTVDHETLELVRLELDEHLDGSPLADAPVVVTDARAGRGLDDLRAALDRTLATAPLPPDRHRPRLWIDRVFAAKGAGTVVTGTLTGGHLAVDDELTVVPSGRRARVRGLETRHRRVEEARPGGRVAVNLGGIEHRSLARGDALVRGGDWKSTTVVDVALSTVPGERIPRRGVVQAHVGSSEQAAHLRALDGEGRFARLRLAAATPLAPGDRIVLRDSGRDRTIAGGEVLDVAPEGRAADAPARLALPLGPRLLAAHPWLRADDAAALAGDSGETLAALVRDGRAVCSGPWIVDRDELASVGARVETVARAHHEEHPLEPGIEVTAVARVLHLAPEQVVAVVEHAPALAVERGRVHLATRRETAAESPEGRAFRDALLAAPFAPPSPRSLDVDQSLVRALAREHVVVDAEGLIFAAAAIDAAREQVVQALRDRGELTVGDVRDLLGSSRRYVLAILARLDAEGVTRRIGDARVAGPQA